jgi:hypothetical protein
MNLSIKELNELIYSLGITAHNGRFVNKDVNESLLERLYCELNERIAEEAIDEEVESSTYYVTNEEADEDFRMSSYFDNMLKEENEYASSLGLDKPKKRGEGTAQSLLDYVDMKGAVSHKELHEYYKSLNGSNTFSWCLKNLRIPYKNRKTQRYLAKEGRKGSNAKWVVKVANPSNWVVLEY